ncbi:hypothetical protein [Halococcus saccharolyticus]|uniref:Uncharacterized protein n=1 Tax=Halococcus saccharolyticus DSM 5350 TaxID=1227455 RepID=M0MFA8_9EURY|nr:hypothetical protein [Halococcus saccharolyticus]EMA43100.1 hypothetical protein C449_14017 [Halococcus saccharolyticus DSM 5350]
MTCPHLEYHQGADDSEASGEDFAVPRAYCTVADRFVQPMRADICNDRYDLDHEQHCAIYREHATSDAP